LEKFLNGNQIVLSAGQLVPVMQAANQTSPKLEIADKSHRAADRALEKFLSGNQIELSAGQLVPAMQAANQTFPKLEIADQSQSH